MKSATTGAVSGCLVWVIACGVLSMCILPVSMAIGGITSVSDFAIQQTAAIVCPNNTTPDVRTYERPQRMKMEIDNPPQLMCSNAWTRAVI